MHVLRLGSALRLLLAVSLATPTIGQQQFSGTLRPALEAAQSWAVLHWGVAKPSDLAMFRSLPPASATVRGGSA